MLFSYLLIVCLFIKFLCSKFLGFMKKKLILSLDFSANGEIQEKVFTCNVGSMEHVTSDDVKALSGSFLRHARWRTAWLIPVFNPV